MPSATIRLFSPQDFFQSNDGGELSLKKNKAVLSLPDGTDLEFPYNHRSNLPLMLLAPEGTWCGLDQEDCANVVSEPIVNAYLSCEAEENRNLTLAQKELLLWHKKWGHVSLQHCQALLSKQLNGAPPIVKPKNDGVSSCHTEGLLCTACAMAKGTRRAKQKAR